MKYSAIAKTFVSYPGHSLGESYLSTEMQSVYSTAWVDEAIRSTFILFYFVLVDHSVVKVLILTLPYKSTSSFMEIFQD